MNIKEDEIKEIKKIGSLNGEEVKLITLKGGFHIGMGRKNKSSKQPDILAVGSHPALVNYQIEKKHGADYEQVMEKNESDALPVVSDYSHNLKSSFKNVFGMDIYSMQKNQEIEFKLTKHNFEACSVKVTQDDGELFVEDFKWDSSKVKNMSKSDVECLCDSVIESIIEYARENKLRVRN